MSYVPKPRYSLSSGKLTELKPKKIKMRINKPNKFCKLYGIELEYEKALSDAEVRLYYVYLRLVDWDSKHIYTFGSTSITIRQLKSAYLPDWSVGKISYTRSSLIQKTWLEKRPEHRVGVRCYPVYRSKSVQLAEHAIQLMRQSVQAPELPVQSAEIGSPEGRELLRKKKEELFGKMKL